MGFAVAALNGSPYEEKKHFTSDATEIWDWVSKADKDGDIITAGSNVNCGSDNKTTKDGIACSHAYTILGAYELKDDNGSPVEKLLKMRNPWGKEKYKGDWSDESTKWETWSTKKVNDAMGDRKVNNEGIFFIDMKSYMDNFSMTSVNQNTHHWDHDYFLMLDDK